MLNTGWCHFCIQTKEMKKSKAFMPQKGELNVLIRIMDRKMFENFIQECMENIYGTKYNIK